MLKDRQTGNLTLDGVKWAKPDKPREQYLVTPMYLPGEFDRPVLPSPDGLVDYYTRELIAPREPKA